jgi:uncharacterized membrane protein YecN with MAPEG domain
MTLTVVPLYAAALSVLFVLLSIRVIRMRQARRIAIGVAGDAELERRVRVQANFVEYVPLTLVLLTMAELRGAPPFLLHALCLCLLAARASHAWGVSHAPENFRFRIVGMVGTFTVIVGTALLLILG